MKPSPTAGWVQWAANAIAVVAGLAVAAYLVSLGVDAFT